MSRISAARSGRRRDTVWRHARAPLSTLTVARLPFAVIAAWFLVSGCNIPAVRADAGAIVVDGASGSILYSYHPDTPHRPASLAKMMALYLAFEALADGRLRPEQTLLVSRNAANQRPSRLGLVRGRMITVENAILALVTKSANDAAVVIAEALAGNEREFADRMTRRAKTLGLTDTTFRNASGLHHRDQWTTARDMASLAAALIRDFPARYRYFATTRFAWKGRRYENHNALLDSYAGADGIKTGYIRQSGYNLVASAERKGRRVIGVVLGSKHPDRRDWQMARLLDFGFRQLDDDGVTGVSSPLPYLAIDADDTRLDQAVQTADRSWRAALAAGAVPDSGARAGREPEGRVWSIQVGAYSAPATASDALAKVATRLPSPLDGAEQMVIPVERDGARFYRARLTGMTEGEARRACGHLLGLDIPCLAIVSGPTALALNSGRRNAAREFGTDRRRSRLGASAVGP